MKIYRGNDFGFTYINGQRISKTSALLDVNGHLDMIMHKLAQLMDTDSGEYEVPLVVIYENVFNIAGVLSGHARLNIIDVNLINSAIDHYQELLPNRDHFVLPANPYHFLRIHCRFAESWFCKWIHTDECQIRDEWVSSIRAYINRLSDYFYILASVTQVTPSDRYIMHNGKMVPIHRDNQDDNHNSDANMFVMAVLGGLGMFIPVFLLVNALLYILNSGN